MTEPKIQQRGGNWYCMGCNKDFDPFAGPHICNKPNLVSAEELGLGPKQLAELERISKPVPPKAPEIIPGTPLDRVLNSTHELFDAVMGLGQRIVATEAQLVTLGGVLEEIYKLLKLTSNTPGSDVVERLERIEQKLFVLEQNLKRRSRKKSLWEKLFR